MSNISGQLIKDSYNYVLQSDLISGIVYRIGGSVAENPKFVSGLTVNANFTYSDGSEFPGFVLTCDATGNAVWSPVSGATSGVVVTGGTFDYSAGTLTLVLSNGVNVPISGLEDIYVTGGVVSGNSIVFSYNDTNTFEVSGITSFDTFTSYTASTEQILNSKVDTSTFNQFAQDTNIALNNRVEISTFTAYTATTQPLILNAVTGGTYSGGTLFLKNNSGATIPITGFTTSSTGDYLPLSGGTLTGGLVANSGITANTISQTSYIDFTTGSTNPSAFAGRLFFDSGEKALSYYNVINSPVQIAMGQQLYTRVWNATGAQIDKGKVISITGTSNNLPSAILAVNNHAIGSDRPIGVAAENIPNGSEGLVINNGILSGITLNTFNNGDTLYLSDTIPGGYVSSTSSLAFSARTNEIGYVIQTGTTTGKIYVNINNEDSNLTLTDIERNILEGNVISTGVYEYTGVTIGTGATINVAPARGWIVRNTYEYATLPDVINLYYPGGTNIPLTYLSTADSTFILINSASTLVQQTTFPTPQERRENIFLGKVIHPSRTSITSVNQTVDFDVSPMSAIRDLWTPLKLINQNIVVSPTGSVMTINKSAGILWGNGIGWITNQLNPDSISIPGTSPTTFQYRTQLGPLTGGTVATGNTTTINPTHYDLNGVVTAVGGGSNSSTNQRIYLFPTGLVRIQLGQKVYGTLAEAIGGVQTEQFVEYPLNAENGILIGILSVNKNASIANGGLANPSYAIFNFVSKFGEILGGTGGLSTTTLQQAYDNSTTPEIVINAALDGLTIKNGTGIADNLTNLLEGLNSVGTGATTSFIRADGAISGTTFFGNGGNLSHIFNSVKINGTTQFSASTDTFINFSGINVTILSGANNTLIFSAGTGGGGSGSGTSITGGAFTYTGNTFSGGTLTLTDSNGTPIPISGLRDTFVTGGTYNGSQITFTNNSGSTFVVSGLTASGFSANYYGSFSDSTNQPVSGANTATVWRYNRTELSNGITVVDNTKITVDNTGVYEIGYSPQIEKTQGTGALVTIWAAINGNPVARSSSTLGLVSNSVLQLPFVSFIFELNANDYVEFYFSSDNEFVQLTALSGLTTPTRPDSPSVIIVAKQVGLSTTAGATGDTFVTGFSLNNNTITLSQNRVDQYSAFTISLSAYTGNTSVSGNYLPLSGGTVTGATNFTAGLTANTISATTYYNLPQIIINNTLTVALTGSTDTNVDFNSIKNAVNSITGATSANTFTVKVAGGLYLEDPFTIPSWVSVVGESSISTVIQANDPSQTLIRLSDQSAIFDCQIQGCTDTGVSAVLYSSSTTPQSSAISYVENVRFGANYTHAKVVAFGGANIIMQCSNVKYGGYPFTVGFYATNNTTGVGRMQLRNVTSTNGGIVTTTGLIFAKADAASCGFIVNGCLLTKAVGAAAGTGFYVENGGFLRLTAVNFQRWAVGIDAPQIGSAPSIDAIALNFENNTIDVNITHSGATGKIQGTDNFLKTIINQDAPLYEVNQDPKEITVAKKGGDFTSVKSAVDYLISSGNTSSTNRYVISVGPGEFTEPEIDLTNTPYVSIVGSNIQTTLIKPSGNTQHIISIGVNNEVSFLTLSGAPSGYSALYCYDIGDFAQAHKLSFYDCDTNVWVESNTQDTKFFGEYLDFNGSYTYGTKVIGNNGYLALANMENYYNFPTGAGITYCNYATGSGATLSVFVGDNVSNGVSGTTAYYIQDNAELNASTITSNGCTYGIRNPNIGGSVTFDVDNVSFVNGEWDLYVESVNTFGTFAGSSSHEKLFTNSSDVYWALLDIDDGEFDITRKASVTFADGTHTDFTTLIFEGGSMGVMSGGTLTDGGGTTINVAAGFGYLEKSSNNGVVKRIDWTASTLSLSANTDYYIYYNENEILSASGTRPDSQYNIVLGRIVTDSTSISIIDQSPFEASHTSNRFGNLFREALGPIYASGSITTEGITPFTLNVTQGEYYYSTNEFNPIGGTGVTFTQYYRVGTGSTWVTTATTLVNNTQYNNNGTLTGLTASAYTKHTLYVVGDGVDEQFMLVIGQDEYSTLVEAENALLPLPPSYFIDSVSQVASIYIRQGNSNIVQIEDIRPTIGFRAGGVNASSVHGNLLGLTADDHLQYLLVDGGRAMAGNLDMGSNNITNAGTINGVTIETHADRHKFGGADPVGTDTPTANAIPYADVNGKLDSWISPITITGVSTQITYYNVDGILTGDTNFTRLDETNDFTTTISSVKFTNPNEYQNTTYEYDKVRSRVYKDNKVSGETFLSEASYTSIITNYFGGFYSGLDISDSSGSLRYTNSSGKYNGFFYDSSSLGWNVVIGGTQYDYYLPQSVYITGSVLTDVSGDGNLTWVVPTSPTFTGGTVSGPTNFTNGLTSNTISATTYQNLPATPFLPLSGGTVSGATRFTGGLTANTISATTYQNLPVSITSVTESANVITVVNSNGQSSSNTIDAVTGGTYSAGQITLSGTGNVNGTQISTKILPVALTVVSNTASTDASLSSVFTLTLTGNTTLATPTNGFSGQRIVYRLRQDGTGNKLLTLSSGFRSGPITVTLSTAANTTDYLGVIYNEIDNEWDVLALNKGYS